MSDTKLPLLRSLAVVFMAGLIGSAALVSPAVAEPVATPAVHSAAAATQAADDLYTPLNPAVRDKYSRAVAERIGINYDQWNPANGFTANEQTIVKVYTYYAELFFKRGEMQWSGMANLAGKVVLAGLQDLRAVRHLLAVGETPESIAAKSSMPLDAIRWFAQLGDSQLKFFETKLVYMHKEVFLDLAWQHDAYAAGGIEALRRLGASGELPAGVLREWENIASGNADRVKTGNKRLLQREQYMVLQPPYEDIIWHDAPIGWLFTKATSLVTRSPIPGGKSFFQWAGPLGNVAKFNDRWDWITGDMLPRYQYLLANDLTGIKAKIQRPVQDGAKDFRLVPFD